MKNNFVKKVWISLGVIFVSIAVASAALYYFSNDLTLQANRLITDRQKEATQDTSVDSLALLKSEQPQAAADLVGIDQILPDQYGLVGFGPWLNSIAAKYNVTVSFSLQGTPTPSNGTSPGTIDFSLSAQGPSGSLDQFINDIESRSSGFLLTLTSFDYTNDPSAGPAAEKLNAQGTLFIR